MIDFTQVITDSEGKEIKVGTKVRYYDHTPENLADVGEVIEITDFEGDVDDDTGRSIMNPPTVMVKYADLSKPTEYTTGEWEHTEGGWQVDADLEPMPKWHHAEGKCEELLVVEAAG